MDYGEGIIVYPLVQSCAAGVGVCAAPVWMLRIEVTKQIHFLILMFIEQVKRWCVIGWGVHAAYVDFLVENFNLEKNEVLCTLFYAIFKPLMN